MFDGIFTYKERPIWYRKKVSGNKGNYIYTFRDDMRKAEQWGTSLNSLKRTVAKRNTLNETRTGYYSFCSNLAIEPTELYLEYKQRWDIEECFSYLKNSVSSSASYAHSDGYFRGWTFLNHISLLYYYGLVNALRDKGISDKYTSEYLIKMAKNIYRIDAGDENGYRISAIQKRNRSSWTRWKSTCYAKTAVSVF